ncbi:MAG: hypothetical protein ABL921_11795 [Pirellula sp.]
MFDEQTIQWVLVCIAFYAAMRCLLSLANLLRERLQELLKAHVKRQQIEAQKRMRIHELREKIRAKKESVAQEKRAA